jgi:hypothetical protein
MFLLVAGLLTAAPVSIAAPGITCARIEKTVCDSFLERFVTVLGSGRQLRIVTGSDITQLLGFERQKALIGCQDSASSSCIAELAGAMGVDGVLSVSVVKSDPSYVITVRVIRTSDAAVWASATERVNREGDVYEALDSVASRFGSALVPAGSGPVAVATTPSKVRLLPFVPGIVGIVAAIAGTAVFLTASSERGALQSQPMVSEIPGLVASGRAKEQAGVGLWIAAGAAVVASVLWLLLGSSS